MDIFGKVAVASTFSPRFLPMLAEAKALAALLDRPLEIIHGGVGTADNQDRFQQAFTLLGFSGPPPSSTQCAIPAWAFCWPARWKRTARGDISWGRWRAC